MMAQNEQIIHNVIFCLITTVKPQVYMRIKQYFGLAI